MSEQKPTIQLDRGLLRWGSLVIGLIALVTAAVAFVVTPSGTPEPLVVSMSDMAVQPLSRHAPATGAAHRSLGIKYRAGVHCATSRELPVGAPRGSGAT